MNGWKAGEVIGFISATAFALTVVYLQGYKTASHLDLFKYLSVNDYFRLAVEWLVPVALLWLVGVAVEAALRRSEHGKSEPEIEKGIAEASRPRFWLAFRRSGVKAPFVVGAVAVVASTPLFLLGLLPRRLYYEIMTIAGPLAWWASTMWYEKENRLVADWSSARRAWVWFFPAMLILSFFRGASTAEQAKAPAASANSTRVFVVGRPSPVVGRVLFNLDNYVLLRTATNGEVEAIPKGQVTLIVEASKE
jgi:hypothetical protein